MRNIIDYATETKDTFENRPFNAVDSLILSKLAYLNYDGFVSDMSDATIPISIKEIANIENADMLFRGLWDGKSNRRLFFALASNPRFRDITMVFYVNKIDDNVEKQFSTITYILDDDLAYISYRGTDATFIGWKESFNMAFTSPIPSQEEGVAYLNTVADKTPYNLIIGGHSKGGNIAVYSSMKCRRPVQDRITQIFSHDGPGFKDEVLLSNDYLIIKDRINKTLPQSSIIGMLLQDQENYSVVKSNRFLIMQHDPFSWLIEGNDFQYVQSVKKSALYINGTLNQWAYSFDDRQRELFVNTLFSVIKATNATTFYDLTGEWPKRAAAVLGTIRGIDDETRKFVYQTIRALFYLAVRNIRDK